MSQTSKSLLKIKKTTIAISKDLACNNLITHVIQVVGSLKIHCYQMKIKYKHQ